MTPTETQVTPPTGPTKGSEKSHLVSSGNVHDPQDPLERNIQLAGTVKTKPLPKGPHGDKDSDEFKPPPDMELLTTLVVDPSGTDAKYHADQTQSTRLRYRSLTKNKGKTSSEVEPDTQTLLLTTVVDIQALLLSDDELIEESDDDVFEAGDEMDEDIVTLMKKKLKVLKKYDNVLPHTETLLVLNLQKVSQALYNRLTEDQWEKHEEAAASYADLRVKLKDFMMLLTKFIKALRLPSAHMRSSLSSSELSMEDPALNKKVIKVIKAYTKNSTNLTKLLTLIKIFDLQGLKSLVDSLQASALRQDEHLAVWAKSSTSKAWNLGPRLTSIESTQFALRSEISSLKQDTYEIKSMMTKIFKAFKGQSSSAPSSSVPTITLTITEGPTTVGRRIYLILQPSFLLKKPLLKLKGRKLKSNQLKRSMMLLMLKKSLQPTTQQRFNIEFIGSLKPQSADTSSTSQVAQREGKGIATDETEEPTMKLVHASREVRQDPDEPIRVLYKIHGKIYQLTNNEIQAHLDKEEKIKKAVEEAKLLAMTKSELID
ncbi:hypothetical protein Tco_0589223 [Tanacetum coccineum]